MSELRWNPLLRDWVMIAPKRQDREKLSVKKCPFCPGSEKVPDSYEVCSVDNDFPSLSQTLEISHLGEEEAFMNADAYGKCEVILYSSEHTENLGHLPVLHIKKLVDLWVQRFDDLRKDNKIKYIYFFENRGEKVGATISHPHGQLYAYPYIPKRIELEIKSGESYFKRNHKCLICDILKKEEELSQRIIIENEDFTAFVPYFSEYPYELFIVSKSHKNILTQFNEDEKLNLARILKEVAGTLDALFNSPFPYMMCMHQGPVNSSYLRQGFHFHIEFYSPVISTSRLKHNAAGETGAWAHVNPTKPEEQAQELRNAYMRYEKSLSDLYRR